MQNDGLLNNPKAMTPYADQPVPAARWLSFAIATGVGLALLPAPSTAQQPPAKETAVKPSPDGNTRHILQSYKNDLGDTFILELVIVPPGGNIPPHSHTAVAHNYILEGEAESQYEGEDLKLLKPGDSYQDKVGNLHKVWHNPSPTAPLKFLVAFTVAKGQPFVVFK